MMNAYTDTFHVAEFDWLRRILGKEPIVDILKDLSVL